MTRDISEYMVEIGLMKPVKHPNLRVVYHSACSMQHGQRIVHQPLDLMRAAGFEVLEVPDGFMCCGSAGIYNLLQSKLAAELKHRKATNIKSVGADVAAAGNIGCMTQLGRCGRHSLRSHRAVARLGNRRAMSTCHHGAGDR